jgi:integron integrase
MMSDKSAGAHRDSVGRFWHNYLSILEKRSIPKRSRSWYRKHAEKYIDAHKGIRLAEHTPDSIDQYLNAKGRLPGLPEWQFRQIADALRLLFCDLIQPQWAAEYDWFKWRAFARSLEPDHPSLMRDGNTLDIVAPTANPVVCKFRSSYSQLHLAFVKTIRVRQMAVRTEKSYEQWISRFLHFQRWPDIDSLDNSLIKGYLEHLAVNRKVSLATQKLALNALIFLFREVLGQETGAIGAYTRASTPKRLPTVLSQDEVKRLLESMKGRSCLMASLMYGSGMRLMECVRLRVQDIDFDYRQITVRMGKGGKDRVVPLPEKLIPILAKHLEEIKSIHLEDLRAGFGAALLPPALVRKLNGAQQQWAWQFVFPATRLSTDPRSGITRRHHIHETSLQKAIRDGARAAGITKRVTSHTMRHCFATHLLESGKDIRLVQELLGHADVSTTMIYTHVIKKGGLAVQSPFDAL